MKIIIAVDGSEYSQKALEQLKKLLSPGMEVLVVNALNSASIVSMLPMSSEGVPQGSYADIVSIAKAAAKKIVNEASDQLLKEYPNVVVTTKVIEGAPKEVILEEAKKVDAELIVVGSHGRGAVGRFLLGSVSQALALHAPCSVMIVRGTNIKDA